MFTGLIQKLGKVVKLDNSVLTIRTEKKYLKELNLGDSIAVNGVCLSLTEKKQDEFSVFVSSETLDITNIGLLKPNSFVNLEKPLKLQDFVHGHLVQGHVDGMGIVEDLYKQAAGSLLKIIYPGKLAPYIILKGSVAVNGVSLTIAKKYANIIEIAIIPETFNSTNFQFLRKGNKVNLETDFLGKYVKQFVGK